MKIQEIKKSQRKQGRFLVKLEDERILRVTEEELLRFGLRPGMELEERRLEEIQAAARASSARVTAANIIGSRSLSRSQLEKRLVEKGTGEDDARAAADWLEEIGAVNDGEYAAAVVRHYSRRGYGAARIREELRRRGVPRELWDKAMEEREAGGEILDELIRKKCRGDLSDPKEFRRVSDSLLRRGFSWGEVREALSRYAEVTEKDI